MPLVVSEPPWAGKQKRVIVRGAGALLLVPLVHCTLLYDSSDAALPVDLSDPCSLGNEDVVSLFTFDEPDLFHDSVGGHGASTGAGERISSGRCRGALSMPVGESAQIGHHRAFELDSGSIDFLLYIETSDEFGTRADLLSKSTAEGVAPGDFSLSLHWDWKLQGSVTTSSERIDFRCSSGVLAERRWRHVVVNWGAGEPVAIHIDGEPADCGSPFLVDLSANREPWTVGGSGDPNLSARWIDHLRISSVRRNFAR